MSSHVKESVLFPEVDRVALFEATAPGMSAAVWAAENADLLAERLPAKGACLLRGFEIGSAPGFAELVNVFGEAMQEYTYRSTPRSKVGDVYTSTEYPASEVIPQHNEMAYTSAWPERLYFYSEISATAGGQTPLSDSNAVYLSIPEAVRERFERHGVRYVRNYREGLGVPWRETFPGMDREQVDRFCAERGIVAEWLDADTLRTTETCQAVTVHPVSGRKVWMNQAHLFHISSLNEATREALLELMPEEDLPRNAYLGDGSRITDEDLAEIRKAFDEHTIAFRWQNGDVLIVDNLSMAHGRFSYEGPRKLLVAMTGAIDGRTLPGAVGVGVGVGGEVAGAAAVADEADDTEGLTGEEAKLALLRKYGADALEHSGSDLLAHLQGVRDLLAAWDGSPSLCDAGLFHSAYGTEIFPHSTFPPELRPKVRALIGEEAETIAYLFCVLRRESIFDGAFDGAPFLLEARDGEQIAVTAAQFGDLATLTVANWLEQRPRFPAAEQRSRATEFEAMRPYLNPAARAALEAAYGFAPQA